ncbi:phage holin family protein [bacterium SCSIO 12741]|nr:phage holin family protein [bacterium SCSIO 12741]
MENQERISFFGRVLLLSISVYATAWLLPGIHLDGFWTGIIVALVLALLNAWVKPLLIIITIPITVLTLGLFLLIINVFVIQLADYLINGFWVDGFWWALAFSLILSLLQGFLERSVQR